MPKLKVYAAEINDDLEDLLVSPESQAAIVLARIEPDIDPEVFDFQNIFGTTLNHSGRDISMAEKVLGVSKDNFDLYPIHTILVTTGWNRNDDVFDIEETWKARHTPEDKPFNLEHDPNKIIGHITGSVAVDSTYNLLSDDTEDIPDKFHILTRSVIYKHINSRQPDLEDEVAELIQGIARNEWFVSMEALFSNFDYGLIHPDGSSQVIARQENTAFLTKHLRAYRGSGEYRGVRIGRLIRNITFSGKGLVRKPANPESVIFNDSDMFKGVLANEQEVKDLITGASNMSDEILRELKDKNATLEQKLANATRKLEEMGEAAVQAKLDAKDNTIAELKEKNQKMSDKIGELDASIKELEKSRDDAVASKIEAEEKLTKAEEQIQKSEAEALKTSRISVLVDKGVEKAIAEKLAADFDDLNDDKFDKLVEMQAELVAAKNSDCEDEENKGKKKSDKSEAEESENEDDHSEEDESTDAETDDTLNTAEEEEDAAMASDNEDEDDADLQSSIASYLGNWLGNRKQD